MNLRRRLPAAAQRFLADLGQRTTDAFRPPPAPPAQYDRLKPWPLCHVVWASPNEIVGYAFPPDDDNEGWTFRAVHALRERWTAAVHGYAWPSLKTLLACVTEVRGLPGALGGDFTDPAFKRQARSALARHGAEPAEHRRAAATNAGTSTPRTPR